MASSSQGFNTPTEGGCTTALENLFQRLATCVGKIFSPFPQSASPLVQPAAVALALVLSSSEKSLALPPTLKAPLRQQSLHRGSTQPSLLQHDQTPLLSLSSCAVTTLVAFPGSLPLLALSLVLGPTAGHSSPSPGDPQKPSGEEGPLSWTCWLHPCQHSPGGGRPPLLRGCRTDPIQLAVKQHPGPFWQRCPRGVTPPACTGAGGYRSLALGLRVYFCWTLLHFCQVVPPTVNPHPRSSYALQHISCTLARPVWSHGPSYLDRPEL